MKRRKSTISIFMQDKENLYIKANDINISIKINRIIESNDRKGYIAFKNVPVSKKVKVFTGYDETKLLIMKKGKLIKNNADHNIDGVVIKNILANIFVKPLAIIEDKNRLDSNMNPTLNFVSEYTRDNKHFYVVVELSSFAKSYCINANIIKTIFDKSDLYKFIHKIQNKEKAGYILLYLE